MDSATIDQNTFIILFEGPRCSFGGRTVGGEKRESPIDIPSLNYYYFIRLYYYPFYGEYLQQQKTSFYC
jgi:hypothetical protein